MLSSKIILFVMLLITPVLIVAQTEESDDIQTVVELEQIGQNDSDSDRDLFNIISPLDDAFMENQNSPDGNHAVIVQHGDENSAILNQEGDRNHIGVFQHGDDNDYEGTVAGENNLIRVLQFGESNFVSQDLGGNDIRLKVTQDGNNHEVYQVEKDGSSPAYQIHQTGETGMKIKVEHQKVIP
ncbi:MAG: hypothetical protein ACOC2M_03480 [bacterium]